MKNRERCKEKLTRVLRRLEKMGYIYYKGVDTHTLRIIAEILNGSEACGDNLSEGEIIDMLVELGYTSL